MKRRQRFPLQLPKTGPADEGEKLFEEIKAKIEKPPKRKWEENAWIRPGTWALVDDRAKLRSLGRLTQAEGRRLTRRIHAALKGDRIECARRAT